MTAKCNVIFQTVCALEIRVLWTSNRRCVVGVAYFFIKDYDEAFVVEFLGHYRNSVGLPLFPFTKSEVKWHPSLHALMVPSL